MRENWHVTYPRMGIQIHAEGNSSQVDRIPGCGE